MSSPRTGFPGAPVDAARAAVAWGPGSGASASASTAPPTVRTDTLRDLLTDGTQSLQAKDFKSQRRGRPEAATGTAALVPETAHQRQSRTVTSIYARF